MRYGRYCLLAALLWMAFAAWGQPAGVAGRNANVVGPPPSGSGEFADAGLRQQNEPSCAVNPENPLQICCGFNDYRGIDIPGLGDAWEGIACSRDGGGRWNSQLIPGHAVDPDYSLGLSFAADPNLVSAPGGLFYNYIAADRDHVGGLYMQRYAWRNRENGWPLTEVGGPQLVSKGTNGRFIDKPFMHGWLNDNSSETVSMSWEDEKGSQNRTLPSGDLGLAAAVFVGNDNNDGTKILYWRSDDWGKTWKQPTKLTESKGVNSGVSLAANGDTVCAVWRRFDDVNETNSIMYACSADRGKRFGKAKVVADICPFDLVTLNGVTAAGSDPLDPSVVGFRSNAFPVVAADGDNFYVFWTDRGYATASGGQDGCELISASPEGNQFNPSYGRVVYSITKNDGKSWSNPKPVEDIVDGMPLTNHQLMPGAYGANGEVVLAWVSNRDDITKAFGLDLDIDKQMIVDIWKDGDGLYRHTTDVRATRLKMVGGTVQISPSEKVSQYTRGLINSGGQLQLAQLEHNLVNARMFQTGTAPFIGDYIWVTALPYTKDSSGNWKNSNTAPVPGSFTFHISWGDNRDVRGNAWGSADANGYTGPSPYTPIQPAQSSGATAELEETSNANPAVQDPADDQQLFCEAVADPADRTRDQNVYTTPFYPIATLQSPGAIKRTGNGVSGEIDILERAMPVFIQNHSDQPQYFRLSIDAQPVDYPAGLASFRQFGVEADEIWVYVWGKSSAVRTVFVSSNDPLPSIPVSAALCNGAKQDCSTLTQIVLSDDPLELGANLEQPDAAGSSIFAHETHDPSLLNPGLLNADLLRFFIENPAYFDALIAANPDLLNPDLLNPDLLNTELLNVITANPDLLNPDLLNPDLLNLILANPDLLNPDLLNPDLLNPDLLNPDLLNTALWELVEENLVLLNEVVANPDLLNPDLMNPDLLNLLVANPDLLNPDLLNTIVANPDLLNPDLLNTIVANPDLLNAIVANPDLLNPDLLNPDLLNEAVYNLAVANPDLMNALVANPDLLNPDLLNPDLLNPDLLNPDLLNPDLLNPDLLNPDLLNQVLANPDLLNPDLLNPDLLNPDLLNPDLLNPDLLNQVLANPDLLNPDLLNPDLLNPDLLNPDLLNAVVSYSDLENPDAGSSTASSGDSYIDVTWQVKNDGNTTSGYMAQTYIAGPEDEERKTQLIVSKPYLTQTTRDCMPVLKSSNNVLVNIPNPVNQEPIINPDPGAAETEGLASFWLAPNEVANVTLRVFHPDSSRLHSGRAGLYVSSEACTTGSACNSKPFVITTREFDQTPPVFAGGFPALIMGGEATGPGGAVVTYVNPEATDEGDGGAVPVTCTFASGALFPVGTTDHHCDATDSAGNTASLEFQVQVDDSTAPTLTVTPPAGFSPNLEADSADGTGINFDAGWSFTAIDLVDTAPTIACVRSDGEALEALFPIGVTGTELSCTATDKQGNTSAAWSTTIVVLDTTAPVITVQGSPFSAEATSAAGAVVFYPTTTSDAVDPAPSLSCVDGLNQDASSGSVFPLGETAVTCTATDSYGNSGSVSFTVAVVDTSPPVIAGMSNITVEAGSPTATLVSYMLPTATDDGDPAPMVVCLPPPGTGFALGDTTVMCTATDASGNTAQVFFTVTVQDLTAPVLSNVPANISVEATSPGGNTVSYTLPDATDLADSNPDVSCAPAPGSLFAIATTTVICTATDDAGNPGTATFTITVEDTTDPVLNLPGTISVPATDGNGSVVDFEVSAEDAASGPITPVCTSESGALFPVGSTTVECTATDDAGNSSSGSFQIVVSVGIVWITPVDDPHYDTIGPNLGLRWGYGTPGDLLNSRDYLATGTGKSTEPVMITYFGESCDNGAPQVVNLDAGKSSLRYSSGEWLLNWQTGQSELSGGSLQEGCYLLEIPRKSGEIDNKEIFLTQ